MVKVLGTICVPQILHLHGHIVLRLKSHDLRILVMLLHLVNSINHVRHVLSIVLILWLVLLLVMVLVGMG